MKSHKQLFRQVCAVGNLLAAAREAVRGKLSSPSAAGFHTRWETHAVALAEEIRTGTWNPGPYTYFDIRKHPCGLPIGNLTSQFFANIYLDGFDHFVKQELRVKGYVRYVDDFLLFADSKQQARSWGKACREYLRALHLEIHPDKYRLCRTDREGADFCGFVCYRSGRVKVCGASVRRYVKRLRLLQKHALHQEIHASVRSWVGHVSHADSWRLRAAILSARKPKRPSA